VRKEILAPRNRFHQCRRPQTGHCILTEDIHEQLEPRSSNACRRVTPWSRLNQCLVRTSSRPTGARSSSGARL